MNSKSDKIVMGNNTTESDDNELMKNIECDLTTLVKRTGKSKAI